MLTQLEPVLDLDVAQVSCANFLPIKILRVKLSSFLKSEDHRLSRWEQNKKKSKPYGVGISQHHDNYNTRPTKSNSIIDPGRTSTIDFMRYRTAQKDEADS
ncbi:hypothetical protein ElyMa_003224600 [Elysia marginata]|uniref:Uncharacterized protein n=1 Tax=Elysia marginata TaxID=1093978 RepID=A0AAV4J7C7_9GAST|nr:hypothetical protein ElyMa_003224600 [Elysia marginata]